MAKKDDAKTGAPVEARVLVDCSFGKVDEVVAVPADVAAAHAHELDTSAEAVAYAKSLKAD